MKTMSLFETEQPAKPAPPKLPQPARTGPPAIPAPIAQKKAPAVPQPAKKEPTAPTGKQPSWTAQGSPENLEAAALDAVEWIILFQSFTKLSKSKLGNDANTRMAEVIKEIRARVDYDYSKHSAV